MPLRIKASSRFDQTMPDSHFVSSVTSTIGLGRIVNNGQKIICFRAHREADMEKMVIPFSLLFLPGVKKAKDGGGRV